MAARYIFAVYGQSAEEKYGTNAMLSGAEYVSSDFLASFFSTENYRTGIPQRIVWEGNLGIILHGIVFPYKCSIDEFDENPDIVLKSILAKHQNDPYNIPNEFINGSYVGFVIDKMNNCFYAFTSFLNSIPLYYCVLNGDLIVSTDFNRIAKVCGKSISGFSIGLVEYYHLGTNLSDHTALDGIFTVPIGAYIKFDGSSIVSDFYYTFPNENLHLSFDDAVDSFQEIWKRNLSSLDSNRFKFGLGLTGGVDSRLILAGWPSKKNLITFTGGHDQHPDYLLASHIMSKIGLKHNHFLEDYSKSKKLEGYSKILMMADNPLHLNNAQIIDQYLFRARMGFTFELTGLTEFLGGVYHYTSRASVRNLIKSTLPVKISKIANENQYNEVLKMGVRENMFNDIFSLLTNHQNSLYDTLNQKFIKSLKRQLNADDQFEIFIERFRHVYKMANLLTWARLPGRYYNELIAPSLNIELTDFGARLPLGYRDNRRLLLTWLKRYEPELSSFVLTGTIFSPQTPWLFHKMLNPYIKAFNAIGFKVPYLQWYQTKRKSNPTLQNTMQFSQFQDKVCQNSEFMQDAIFESLYQNSKNDKLRRWRLFNIAMTYNRINYNDSDYEKFIYNQYNQCV